MISVCGIYCETECKAFGDECKGCNQLQGKVAWTKFIGKSICPIYACVKDNEIANCGFCPDLPCQIMLVETKEPDKSDEQYAKDIKQRIENLKRENNLIK